MTTTFPGTLDALTNPNPTDPRTAPSHAGQHQDENDAIEALEAKVGINSSAVASSLDKKVADLQAAQTVATHAAAADPHTGYRLESADHTHASTGIQAGQIAHSALTGLSNDEHPQYLQESLFDAKGDLISATADNTPAKVTVGANDTILMADSAAAAGLKWVASQTPSTQASGDAAAEGTADTYARGDHKHAFPVLLQSIDFSKGGTLAVGVGAFRWYNRAGRTLTFDSITASVGTAPTGTSIIIDVNKGGTTIYSTQGNRPTIAVSTFTHDDTTAPNTTTIADNEYLTIDIDQVGSGVAGADLTVQVWLRG